MGVVRKRNLLTTFTLWNIEPVMKIRGILHVVIALSVGFVSVPAGLAAPLGSAEPSVLASVPVIRVPSDVTSLQIAIDTVPDGGTIEIASGTYTAPTGGFRITNTHRRFTMRASVGASVILSGGGTKEILRFMNTDFNQSGPVVFQHLTFANGRSNLAGIAGGVTMHHAEATFVNCVFRDSSAGSQGVGGGTLVGLGSIAFFFDSTWQNNTAVNYGGGLVVGDQSKVYVHHSKFTGNRTNLPNHSPTAAGGGIHVGNSLLRVSNSRFENNQAGYVGGAIYAIGTWANPVTTPQADVLVTNSTFVGNLAFRDPSVSQSVPTEGGAFHAEGQTTAKIFNSRFVSNRAMAGGAITIYQAIVEIDSSAFMGNSAQGQGSLGGYGGAISASSNDTSSDGSINRRNVTLNIRNSYFQGRYGSTNTVAYGGGGVFIAGDINRMYGMGGVSKMGSVIDNRATLFIDNVVFNDLDVIKGSDEGMGGGVFTHLVDATIQKALFMNNDGLGSNAGSGGGITIIDQSQANISESTFALNSSGRFGGALYVSGSTIYLLNSMLIENSVGSTEYGSAIFTAPFDSTTDLDVTGIVQGNVISNNPGVAVFDDDRTNGPINSVVYNDNDFYAGSVNAVVYSDAIYPFGSKNVSQLNALIVNRANGTSTDKSTVDNRALSSKPSIGSIQSAPFKILETTAVGDPETQSPSYVAYAWSGGSAVLNGSSILQKTGVLVQNNQGSNTLTVDGVPFASQTMPGALPGLSFSGQPSGGSVAFNWSVVSGTYLGNQMDQGVRVDELPIGSVVVQSVPELVYRFYAIAEEGGIVGVQDLGALSSGIHVSIPFITR